MVPTILVVEDNAMNLELVRDVLTSAKMKVVEARTAQEGLTAAAEIIPDLILLDIRLPDMDGYAMLERPHQPSGGQPGGERIQIHPAR